MVEKILARYGLSEKEIKLYLALLTEGRSIVSDIAKKSETNRSTAYVLLESLIAKGLVTTTEENKVKQYSALPPSGLRRSLEDTIGSQQELLVDLTRALPDLEKIYNKREIAQSSKRSEIQFYEGVSGIKAAYDQIMKSTGEFFILGGSENKFLFAKGFFVTYFDTLSMRKEAIKYIATNKIDYEHLRKSSNIEAFYYDTKTLETIIFENNVAIISLENKYAYILKNNEFARTYRLIYEKTWQYLQDKMHIVNTPLITLDALSKEYKIRALLKDESKNLHGTIKDRRNFEVVRRARESGVDKVAVVTAGNNGYSLSMIAKQDPGVVCLVDDGISTEVENTLKKGAKVIKVNLEKNLITSERVLTLARTSDEEYILDVTTGYDYAYQSLVDEVLEKCTPDYIVVPVGSGELYVGIVNALKGKNIKVIGVGSVKNNNVADKLVPLTKVYQNIIRKMEQQGNPIYKFSEQDIAQLYERYHGVADAEPSSTLVYGALKKHKFKKDATIVFVNTGRSKFSSRSDSRFFLTHFGE